MSSGRGFRPELLVLIVALVSAIPMMMIGVLFNWAYTPLGAVVGGVATVIWGMMFVEVLRRLGYLRRMFLWAGWNDE